MQRLISKRLGALAACHSKSLFSNYARTLSVTSRKISPFASPSPRVFNLLPAFYSTKPASKEILKANLSGVFDPKSIAIIGASNTEGKIGHTVVKNLINGGYSGKIYPINPKETKVLGLDCYKSIKDVPGACDAACITIPAKFCMDAVKECGEHAVKGLIVITSGFSEVGETKLEEDLVKLANSYGCRLLGPNIVGTLANSTEMNASFAPYLPYKGKSSLISQSGALLIGIDGISYVRHIGFEKLVSIGNAADVSFEECVDYLAKDKETACISMYVEGLKDGRQFMDVSRKAGKPITLLKSGISQHGAEAAASHTGSLAGSKKVFEGAMRQCGVVTAATLNQLFDRTQALSMLPPLKGENLLVITNGGGVGVLATDSAEMGGLPLKFAPQSLQDSMYKLMPSFGSPKNPVDLTGMAGKKWYGDAIREALKNDWVDGVCVLYCETAQTSPSEIAGAIADVYEESGRKKPLSASFIGGERSNEAMTQLGLRNIPCYGGPDQAIDAMTALREYHVNGEYLKEPAAEFNDIDRKTVDEVLAHVKKLGRKELTEFEAKKLFAAYGLPVVETHLATNIDEAEKLGEKIGYPLVLKICSRDILHKSDAGGVKVNIKNKEQVREWYKTITDNGRKYKADAEIDGVVMYKMADMGTEVILGSVQDATFGPTVMYGLGGIFVEVLKDVAFRVAPVSHKEAWRMQGEINGAPILEGVRGEKPRDQKKLNEVLTRYAYMVNDLKDHVSESDANPVMVYEEKKGLCIVDARMVLK